jgi:hypothetical protein
MTDTRTNAERRLAYKEMRETARLLRDDHVLSSSSQAVMWERHAAEVIEPILAPAARAVLAEFFGGAKLGYTPDCATVESHVVQNTAEWQQARHYARTALEAAWKAEDE